ALSTEMRALSIHPCRESCIPSPASGEGDAGAACPLFVATCVNRRTCRRGLRRYGCARFVERVFGLEAEVARAARLDALRPARDDARDQRGLSGANARGHALAGDAP